MTDQRMEGVRTDAVARASMLRVANAWQALGQVNQALDTYLRILARYPDSAEAREAGERIRVQAEVYERRGQLHLALGLYDKLEARP